MPRKKKVSVGAINITMQPHKPESYVKLFQDAKRFRCLSRISKDKSGIIASAMYLNKDKGKTSPLTGDIYRFTDIDLKGSWFNFETNEHAKDNELDSVNIPENLKPNSSRFSYIFFPESHILFYESYYDGHSLGNKSALKLIEGVLNNEKLVEKYGVIDVTVIPSKEKLKEAMSIYDMNKLTMLVKRPNPDDHSSAEEEVLKRLASQNVKEYRHQLIAVSGESIKPDNETTILTLVASNNGYVTVNGKNEDGIPVEYKTTDHPWTDVDYYDPDIQTGFGAFSSKILRLRIK